MDDEQNCINGTHLRTTPPLHSTTGNTNIKLIAKTIEETFNIDLGDFYHAFMELKESQ